MASGTIKSSIYSGAGEGYPDHVYVEWSSTTNVSNNTSTITWKCYGGSSYTNTGLYVSTGPVTVVINGTTVLNLETRFKMYKDQLLGSGSLTVAHNDDGTKSVSVNISAAIWSYTAHSTYSGTITLDTIPRKSMFTLSKTQVDVEDSITVNITRASSSFTHHVRLYIDDTYSVKYSDVGTSKTITIPASWYAAMPNSTSIKAYCSVATYNGSAYIGNATTQSFTVVVPDEIKPTVGTITLTPEAINGNDILVQNKNTLSIAVSGSSAGEGSTIKSYTYSGPGISKTTTSTSVTSDKVTASGALTYTVTVTDSRGRKSSSTATITSYAYSSPSFKSFSAYKSNSSGTADNSGSCINCTYTPVFSSVNGTNKISVVIKYETGGTTNTVTSLTDSTATTSQSKLISSVSSDSTYTVYAIITDSYGGNVSSTKITVFGGTRVWNITKSGTGIAFGKMAEEEELFECRWNTKFNGDVEVAGALNVGTVLYSNSSGTNGTITLSYSAADYTYLEIFYTDNYGRQPQSAKIYAPNGNYITLSCIEPSAETDVFLANIRTSGWTISETSMTPGRSDLSGANSGVYAQVRNHKDSTASQCQTTVVENNYIKIVRILGYK